MYDFDTFLTLVYVMIDDLLNILSYRPRVKPGPPPSLSTSEVLTLCVVSHLKRFTSERDFWRFAMNRLQSAFPTLPCLSQFNRMRRKCHSLMSIVATMFGDLFREPTDLFEALDGTAAPIRNYKRRGNSWLSEHADIGLGHRIGWYFGFHVLASVVSSGAVTGFGIAPANAKDQPFAEAFFASRQRNDALRRKSNKPLSPAMFEVATVGLPPARQNPYLTDKGFQGAERHKDWLEKFGAMVITPPKVQNTIKWPKSWHKFLAAKRQIVETTFHNLHNTFGLTHERPHEFTGFIARLASRIGLNNICIAINRLTGRSSLEFADLVAWQ